MQKIKFDFNNLFAHSIGDRRGVSPAQLSQSLGKVKKAHEHLIRIARDNEARINLNLEWLDLPFQGKKVLRQINHLAQEIKKYDNVIFLGIGGSYLGLKAAQDALGAAYYNEFSSVRKGKPKVYFEGNNLDPDTLAVLLKRLNPKKTFVVVISKSGETTETKAAFMALEDWLKKGAGEKYGRQIIAITDPESGALRQKVNFWQSKDILSFRSLPLLRGVGGRFSELNIGLLHLALLGVNLQDALDGASYMRKACLKADIFRNPAYMYALLHTILYFKKAKSIAIIMPFSERLKSTADWYCQMLAESLGKKYSRKIVVACGKEQWLPDKGRVVNLGRTPIASRGTNDLHSIQQNNIEGRNDKVVTFIRVEKFSQDIKINAQNDILAGSKFSALIRLAQEATEWAMVREARPNCAIILPCISAYYWGALLMFFEIATAFEGELLNINAFDQPGVEGYKNYMYYKLNKPNLPKEIKEEIRKNPLIKKRKYII